MNKGNTGLGIKNPFETVNYDCGDKKKECIQTQRFIDTSELNKNSCTREVRRALGRNWEKPINQTVTEESTWPVS